ncbi:MAG: threonine synthase [Bacteroidales bacterium]
MKNKKEIISKFTYQCVNCGKEITTSEVIYLCYDCEKKNKPGLPLQGVLKVNYDYDTLADDMKGSNLFYALKNDYFIDILPIRQTDSIPGLDVGETPLYEVDEFEGKPLNTSLFVKNDSRNPTLSYKDRASIVVSAFASDRNINQIMTASTGNAGSSLAGICAAQGQQAVIIVPEKAPTAKLIQIAMSGATIIPIKGNYDEAYDLSIQLTRETGIYNRNTAFNPITIEGKKTAAFEIYDQLDGVIPDNLFIPVGDGAVLSGLYKGFEEMMKLHITKMIPTIIAVQAEGSPNLVNNLGKKEFKSVKSKTIADSISVDVPRNFYMASQYIAKYHGEGITVTDDQIIEAARKLARNTGIFAEPAAAAAMAGFLKWHAAGKISRDAVNLVLITGSGLKDVGAFSDMINIPKAVSPDVKKIKKHFNL